MNSIVRQAITSLQTNSCYRRLYCSSMYEGRKGGGYSESVKYYGHAKGKTIVGNPTTDRQRKKKTASKNVLMGKHGGIRNRVWR